MQFGIALLKQASGLPLILDYQGSLTGECIDHGFFTEDSRASSIFRRLERTINGWADQAQLDKRTAGDG